MLKGVSTANAATSKATKSPSPSSPENGLFRRPEVWLLIVLAGAGSIWFAFFQEPAPELPIAAAVETSARAEAPQTTLEFLSARAEDSGDHWVIELTVRAENPTTTDQALAAPFVRLLEPDGSEIPEFYLPFAKPQTLSAGDTGQGELRYFLPKGIAAIDLALGEQRLPLVFDEAAGEVATR